MFVSYRNYNFCSTVTLKLYKPERDFAKKKTEHIPAPYLIIIIYMYIHLRMVNHFTIGIFNDLTWIIYGVND